MILKDLKIIFLGTPEFAVPTLKKIIENNLKPFLVITQPDKPVGRTQKLTPPPIKDLALEHGIEILQPENKDELAKIFEINDCDVAILVAYGMIIPDSTLQKPKMGFLNLHPSLLPKHRGSSPIQQAILDGDEKTGVTVMKLSDKVDAGPILAQKEIAIHPSENYLQLSQRLAEAGAELLVSLIPDYLANKIDLKPQDHSQASYTKIISRADGQIDWQKTALEIDRQFRAFYPWPGVFTHISKKRLKIAKLSLLKGDSAQKLAGEVFLGPNKELAVKSGAGAVILELVQLEGKKEVSGPEFLHGHKDLVGKILN